MTEIYISTDVETDGPIPGPHSMLSMASAAYTAEWWETQPEAWAACRKDPEDPAAAMQRYVEWIKTLPGRPVFVAYPAGFD